MRWVSVKRRGAYRGIRSRRVLRVFGDQLEKTAGHSSPEIQESSLHPLNTRDSLNL